MNASAKKISGRLPCTIISIAVIVFFTRAYGDAPGISSAFRESKDITLSAFRPSDAGLTEWTILLAFTPVVAAGDDLLIDFARPSWSEGESRPLEAYSDTVGVYVVPVAAGLWATGYLAGSEGTATLGRDVLVAQRLSLAA